MALMDNDKEQKGVWDTKVSQQTGAFAGPMMNEMLYADLTALQRQELGKTEAEKEQGAGAEYAAAARQAAALAEDQNRYAASQGGFSGRYAEQSRDITGEAVESGAAAYAREDRDSREQAEARRAEVLAAGARRQDANVDRRRYQNESHNTRATNVASSLSMMAL